MELVACVQMRASDDVGANLDRVETLVARAARHGAVLVATPENTTFLGDSARKVELAEPLDGPTHHRLARLARSTGAWLLVGSVAERCDDTRCYNTSLLYDSAGELRAWYRKLHLFDIDIPGGPSFQESRHIAPGKDVVVAETPIGRLGLSICYDVRFPELYGRLVRAGAQVIAVPSAFTAQTGKDHWHPLLRARAIETQTWVLAPAQEGSHGHGRHSYGHSLIVDPWGTIVADHGEGEGVVLAELDLAAVERIRRALPVSDHRRL